MMISVNPNPISMLEIRFSLVFTLFSWINFLVKLLISSEHVACLPANQNTISITKLNKRREEILDQYKLNSMD